MINKIIEAFSGLLGITFADQWLDVLSPRSHSLPIKNHRAGILRKRIKFFSLFFAWLIPLWSILDYLLLPFDIWYKLAILRLISGLVFAHIYYRCTHGRCPTSHIFICLSFLLYTPTIFYLISIPILADVHLSGFSGALVDIYSLLPIFVIASLSIFTLTLIELLIITLPLAIITLWSIYPKINQDFSSTIMYIWLFFLLTGTSFFSSLSQMRYMISQVTRTAYDSLTRSMTRRAGIEALEVYFRMAKLQETHLSVLFIDLDHFKSINDTFGHDAGDTVLQNAVAKLKHFVRKGDSVIRWGGEEFLVVLPYADQEDALHVVHRIFQEGLGTCPNGKLVTASMGLAEINQDETENWQELVKQADQRLYQAKESGRSRCIGKDKEVFGNKPIVGSS